MSFGSAGKRLANSKEDLRLNIYGDITPNTRCPAPGCPHQLHLSQTSNSTIATCSHGHRWEQQNGHHTAFPIK